MFIQSNSIYTNEIIDSNVIKKWESGIGKLFYKVLILSMKWLSVTKSGLRLVINVYCKLLGNTKKIQKRNIIDMLKE